MQETNLWKNYCFKPESALEGNAVKLFKDSETAFAELLNAINSAEKYLMLEFYAFADDAIGRKFKDALLQKAQSGVRVYLVYDSIGSILTNRDFFLALAAGGVYVREYRPVIFWKPYWNWIKRDHRKIVCVDGRSALIGGFNITANDAPVTLGGRGWKDALLRAEGPVTVEIEKLFRESWAASTPVSDAISQKADFAVAPGLCPAAGNVRASVVSASGLRNLLSIRRSYSYAIDRAKTSIYITNAYFLPDRFVYRRLIKAVERGVDVRIIGPAKTDHPYVRWATWAIYLHMVKRGIKIYEWQGEILHSKTAVIDGIWASVGSHNLDHRSLHYNLEMNLNVYDATFGAEMNEVFLQDLANSKQITVDEIRSRPFLSKAGSKLLYLFRSWL